MRTRVVAAVVFAVAACGKGDPPAPEAGTSASIAPLPASLASLPPIVESAPPPPRASASQPAPTASAAASATEPEADPGALPQTDQKPDPQSAVFQKHVAELWDAIRQDKPELALGAFFPVGAYQQVKDIPKPENDYNRRLIAAFKRDIHQIHTRLGANAEQAKMIRVEVPMRHAKWVRPHEEVNKGSYWRVFGTRVFYEDDGRERFFEIMSLISWRGEWYVVHLRDFK